MLVKFVLLTRRKGLSREAFAAHWRGPHAALLANLADHRRLNTRYVQNHLVEAPDVPALGDADGIAQTWPRDRSSLENGFHESPRYRALVFPDVLRFVDTGRTRVVYAEGRTAVREDRPGGAKLLAFVRAPAGHAVGVFLDSWEAAHAALLCDTPGLTDLVRGAARYRVLKAQAPGEAGRREEGAWCHAVVEIRCDDLTALRCLLAACPGAAGLCGAAELVALQAAREELIYTDTPAQTAVALGRVVGARPDTAGTRA
jgi:hypothetical protein